MADEQRTQEARIPFHPTGFCPKHGRQVLAFQDAGQFSAAASALLRAFVWEESPEGHEFWQEEYKYLENEGLMAEGALAALLAHINAAEAEQEHTKE